MRRTLVLCLLAATVALAAPVGAGAAPVPAGVQPGRPMQAGVRLHLPGIGNPLCGVPVLGSATCGATGLVTGAIGSGVGAVAGAVASSVLDVVASWLIGAATTISRFVAQAMRTTTTPELESRWYARQFAPMADLGAALALLVALIAFTSAALRRSPDALAATLAGIVRAGLGTGVIIAVTAIGLGVADQISADVVGASAHGFWSTVQAAWGHAGFGGFGSSALACLIAMVEVLGALAVWMELIVRDAAIYVAVLFFPVALAASIWPALGSWTSRLARLLLLFIALKPVTLIVLSLAGNAAAAGLSFGGGLGASVGTILAASAIYVLAALSPWALMYLLAADAESAWTGGALRAGAGEGALRARRVGGRLASLPAAHTGSGSRGGGASGSHRGRGGSNGNGGGGGNGKTPTAPTGGGAAAGGGAGALASGVLAGGSVGAAAGHAPAPAQRPTAHTNGQSRPSNAVGAKAPAASTTQGPSRPAPPARSGPDTHTHAAATPAQMSGTTAPDAPGGRAPQRAAAEGPAPPGARRADSPGEGPRAPNPPARSRGRATPASRRTVPPRGRQARPVTDPDQPPKRPT
jgi:hypothetical protein